MNFLDKLTWEIDNLLRNKEKNQILSKNKLEQLPNSSNKSFNGSFFDKFNIWLDNAMLGDLDYARQLEMLNKEMAFNSAEAEKNRQFNLYTANTAYQRQAEDLQNAGFNPGLVLGGSGATVSSSQTANVGGHSVKKSGSEFGAILGLVVNSALSIANNAVRSANALAVENVRNNRALTLENLRNNHALSLENFRFTNSALREKEKYNNSYDDLKRLLKYKITPLKPGKGYSTFGSSDYNSLSKEDKEFFDFLMS